MNRFDKNNNPKKDMNVPIHHQKPFAKVNISRSRIAPEEASSIYAKVSNVSYLFSKYINLGISKHKKVES